MGAGIGAVSVASTDALVSSVPASLSSVAGGVQQTSSQLGGVIGTAALTTMVTAHVESSFRARLVTAGISDQDLIDEALEGASRVFQGEVPDVVSPSPESLEALTAAAHTTVVEAMTSAMAVSWMLAAIGIILALMVKRTQRRQRRKPRHP